MRSLESSLILRSALVAASISSASCGSAANYVMTGRWEDPNAKAAFEAPTQSSVRKSKKTASTVDDEPDAATPALEVFPSETTFVLGSWSLYRNSRGLFLWTGNRSDEGRRTQ